MQLRTYAIVVFAQLLCIAGLSGELEQQRQAQDRALEQGERESVREHYHALALSNPTSATAQYLFGRLVEDDTEALQWFQAATRLDPEMFWPHHALGVTLLQLERYHEAAEALRRAAILQPDHAPTHLNLALAALYAGDLDESRLHAQRAQELDPSLPQLPELLEHLARMAPAEPQDRGGVGGYGGRPWLLFVVLLIVVNAVLLLNMRRKAAEVGRTYYRTLRRNRNVRGRRYPDTPADKQEQDDEPT